MDTPYNALTGGLAETMQMPRHPWLRMVTEEGDLYSVGFAWKTPTKPHNIANTVKGVFRMPDPYETMPIQARPVTRISIDKEQFDKIKKNIETYQKEGIAFNLLQHNCTRFIEYILNDIGIKPPLKTSISEVAERILPIGIKKIFTKIKKSLPSHKPKSVPLFFIKLKMGFSRIGVACRNLILLTLGGRKAEGGRKADRRAIFKKGERGEIVTTKKAKPLVRSGRRFFKNKEFLIPLPRKLIEWQLLQKSTTVYPAEIGFHGQYGAVTRKTES